jgi:hypothetical protein
MTNLDRIFFLIPIHRKNEDVVDLYLPSDLIDREDWEVAPSLSSGVFTFLRSAHNRGKTRHMSFPAVIGFGKKSRTVNLTLQSAYMTDRTIKADQFSFVEDETVRQLGINASFSVRKFSPEFQLAGTAVKFSPFSLWALIPKDREHLEQLWAEHAFYLIGHGALDEDNNSPNA